MMHQNMKKVAAIGAILLKNQLSVAEGKSLRHTAPLPSRRVQNLEKQVGELSQIKISQERHIVYQERKIGEWTRYAGRLQMENTELRSQVELYAQNSPAKDDLTVAQIEQEIKELEKEHSKSYNKYEEAYGYWYWLPHDRREAEKDEWKKKLEEPAAEAARLFAQLRTQRGLLALKKAGTPEERRIAEEELEQSKKLEDKAAKVEQELKELRKSLGEYEEYLSGSYRLPKSYVSQKSRAIETLCALGRRRRATGSKEDLENYEAQKKKVDDLEREKETKQKQEKETYQKFKEARKELSKLGFWLGQKSD